MKTKLLLAGTATVVVLGAVAAISWAGSSPSMPAQYPGMAAMHRGIEQTDVDRMVEICEQAMERMHDGMMGGGMMAGGMMGR